MFDRLPTSIVQQNTVQAAHDLIGKMIVHRLGQDILAGIIIETEAYTFDDPASHAFGRKTKRNAPMFGPVGYSYVYFIYGNHYCLNIVAKDIKQEAGAVLIRALRPIEGIKLMMENRGQQDIKNLTSGPGKLTQAMGITLHHNNINLLQSNELFLTQGIEVDAKKIIATKRIGISHATEMLRRFVFID